MQQRSGAMRVLVLGAGFAGMGAAQRLKEHGVEVSVLEGSHRVGGRAHTMDVRRAHVWRRTLQLAASCTGCVGCCKWTVCLRLFGRI